MAKKKDADDGDEGEKSGLAGKLKLVAMILPTVLLIVGAVYFLVLAPSSSKATTGKGTSAAAAASTDSGADGSSSTDGTDDGSDPVSTYQPGPQITVDPVTVNLANGHFLQVGLLLQASADASTELTGLKAKDALITQFSGKTVDELATPQARDAAKKALTKVIKKLYEQKVYQIFYTSFVMN